MAAIANPREDMNGKNTEETHKLKINS